MKALVTGAAGFIGGHIVDRLLAEGHQVQALDLPTADFSHLAQAGAETVVGDITTIESIRPAMVGVETVFHAAARVTDWGPWEEFEAINVRGTENVLEAAASAGVRRFVHLSTVDVYDATVRKRQVLDESAPYDSGHSPYGPYAKSKVLAEKAAFRYQREGQLMVSLLRPGWVYGPRDHTMSARLLSFLRSPLAAWVGNRNPIHNPVFVTDVADAALAAAGAEQAAGQAYNIAFDQEVRLRDFADAVCRAFGIRPLRRSVPYAVAYALTALSEAWARLRRAENAPALTRAALYVLAEDLRLDVSKAKRELGWSAKVGIGEGVEATAAWARTRARG